MKLKMCALGCGHRVGKGRGDRHGKLNCPPKAGGAGLFFGPGRHRRVKRNRWKNQSEGGTVASNDGRVTYKRGEAVKGTGKAKGKET